MTELRVPRLTFLLGIQRSGSTWLTNILDAHEDTWVFMEPFAPDYGIFADFPETSLFLEESSPGIEQVLREKMPKRLLHYKQGVAPQTISSARWFRAQRGVLQLLLERRRLLPRTVAARLRKTELLNLNRMDADAPIVDKSVQPETWVIKELRLAGKVKLLAKAYPEARFVALIRHPCANVQAIDAWFRKGRLKELRRDLDGFVAKLSAQVVGQGYQRELELCRRGGELERIALYWRVHNEALQRSLADNPNALVLTYEELASAPEATARRVFAHCGLSASETALRYVRKSSTSDVQPGSPITTVRDSASHYRAWEKKISPALRERALEVVNGSSLLPLFAPFYTA